MAARMLIDATAPEENRVAVVDGKKLVSFDFESTARKQLKSNVYLAKITRVEPSLQAAFVDYGGNRHGFLAFSEIHPDYYRIPVEDREALIAEEAELAKQQAEEEEKAEAAAEASKKKKKTSKDTEEEKEDSEVEASDEDDNKEKKAQPTAEIIEVEKDKTTETVGGEQAEEDDEDEVDDEKNLARRLSKLRRRYKIQEVIKPRQILLIQVTKEERGNKGAALTTYISLPGRYCVLMPNSPRGGGVSRKIANPKDRKRLKEILKELKIPTGMSVILRTAGVSRNKTEIKRDLDYLLRLWNNIRKETLESTAPALIYEEGDLCKRAVRDLYTPDVSEVLVAGSQGYRRVKDFMKMLVPSHAKKVVEYKDEKMPLFQRYQVESEINDIFNPRANLPSGGYIIINPTEALVSIDVNSGRATRERNVDDMALKTNLEAAVEIARQLRLRDLGGLVVIDFIDMEHYRHNSKVERKLKEAMSSDRARIEIGRISGFGLLELSRQRLRPSLTETHFETCPSCEGTGIVRTVDSAALVVLRAIEEEGIRGRASQITVTAPAKVALYILNHKREVLAQIESTYDCQVFIRGDKEMQQHELTLEHSRGNKRGSNKNSRHKSKNNAPVSQGQNSNDDETPQENEETASQERDDDNKTNSNRGRGRRRSQYRTRRGGRGRGRHKNQNGQDQENQNEVPQDVNKDAIANNDSKEDKKTETSEDKPKKRGRSSKAKKATENKSVKIDIAEGNPDEAKAEKKETKPKKKAAAKKKVPKESEKAEKKEPALVSAGGDPDYVKVNAAPEEPKKGWWNKLVE